MYPFQSLSKGELLRAFVLVIGYGLFFYALQFYVCKTGLFATFPTADNVANWDAAWYRSVSQDGYSYSSTGQSNSGFFYLFPAIWSITGLGGLGVSVVNVIFFASGFSILSGIFRLQAREQWLWLSMPAVFFAFVPYSEALFFMLSAVCLLGIKEQNKWLIWTSLFLLSLTRATAIFAIPAFLVMELTGSRKSEFKMAVVRYFWLYILPSVAGLTLFVAIQYRATGVWFAYFKAQATFWRRFFTEPVFPLQNGTGDNTGWLNALAIFFCLAAFIFIVVMIVQWLIDDKPKDKMLMLSSCYLSMTLFTALFYSPQWVVGKTDMMGTFRYAMMTPFFYVFLHHFTKIVHYKWLHYLLVILLASALWMAFGAYLHFSRFVFFSGNTAMIVCYMLHTNRKLTWPAILLTSVNFFMQAHLFQQYLMGTSLVD